MPVFWILVGIFALLIWLLISFVYIPMILKAIKKMKELFKEYEEEKEDD